MEKLQKSIFWALLISETSHVFCCVLPTVFSILSLMTTFGLMSAMPGFMLEWHNLLHGYELPIIGFSAIVLCVGWGLYLYAKRIDCHDHSGCSHGPCAPKKDRSAMIMKIATALFVVNLVIYLVLHQGVLGGFGPAAMPSVQDHMHAH